YVKSCHTWVEAYPEIAYQADQRFKNHFHNLVREAPELAEFFENYRERVKLQCQTWREQQAEIAERQRHQEALRRMEVENLRLAQAIASTSEGVIITDPHQPDNPIIYSNPAFSRITGYSAAEILGCNCRFLQGEHTDRQMIAKIRQAINERREFTATLLNYRKNGQPFWNELKLSPVFADNGELLYFVGIQADVTAEKSLEEERIQLWQREQIARTEAEAARNQIINILESITDAFCALDKNWQFIYLNTQAEVLLQRPKEELIGQNVWDKFPEALGSTFSQEFDKALSQQISAVFEAYYAPLETWFTVHAYPSASGLSIYFQDINKRKQNEVALQESEARFRRLVDSNIIAVMIANLNGGITVANDAFLNMLGYSREDLLAGNLRCNQMTLPEYKELDQIALEALRSGGVCTPYEKAFRRQNGSSVPVLIGAALLEGLPDTCICFVLDLSEQKQHQEALRKTNQMLQALIVAAPLAILTLDLQKNIQM
ncbi:MAG TPA: PAS domain S-box protein, partial [Phormidium sp.]